jgi:hypothetical protein
LAFVGRRRREQPRIEELTVNRASKSAIRLIVGALLGAATLGGCGGGATGVSAAELTRMRTEIAAARTAAATANPTGVLSELGALRQSVTLLHSRGALTDGRARTLLTEIGQAQARVATDVPAGAAAAGATTPPLATAPSGPASAGGGNAQGPDGATPHDNGPGKDHGKALGLGKHPGKHHGGGNGGD